MTRILKHLPIILLSIIVILLFRQLVFSGKLPIPADTIIGLYHPYRDLYAKEYPNGIPYKNFLITDPVRQQYPWRLISVDGLKSHVFPIWNPYSMAGVPQLANIQSASFYPFNILLLMIPFPLGWSLLILLQPLLAGIFLYLYLRNLKLHKVSSFFGAVCFMLSGFFIAWLEWGTVLHVALWLPLVLLAIDRLFESFRKKDISSIRNQKSKVQFTNKKLFVWSFLFIFSLASSFFAGHIQVFFYLSLVVFSYIALRWMQHREKRKSLVVFVFLFLITALITFPQWITTLQLLSESARDIDQANWQKVGWFIPWQHLIQFIAPDFFGNPATLNYWGVWNYAEFLGYIGIVPLIFAIFALFQKQDKKTFFFGTLFLLSLLFSLPTIFAKIPYIVSIPFLSTSQPSRLLFITDFSLAVLAALGFDLYLKSRRRVYVPLLFIAVLLTLLWIFVIIPQANIFTVSSENLAVAKRNLYLPTILFLITTGLIVCAYFIKEKKASLGIAFVLIAITMFDLLRLSQKFTPFTDPQYLFPKTTTVSFLEKNLGNFRIMSTDSRILPPNFPLAYKLQSVDGYDPLYLRRYGELIYASEANKTTIPEDFTFNRIITPQKFDSRIMDLLGVKYILSLQDLEGMDLVHKEGETRVYENNNVLPRAFFVEDIKRVNTKEEALKLLLDTNTDLRKSAIIEDTNFPQINVSRSGKVEISEYEENVVKIKTQNISDSFLVLTDSYYPIWRARIVSTGQNLPIYRTNYHFRGVIIPKGEHIVEFYTKVL